MILLRILTSSMYPSGKHIRVADHSPTQADAVGELLTSLNHPMEPRTKPDSSEQADQRSNSQRSATARRVFRLSPPQLVACMSAWIVAVLVGYGLGVRITLNAAREAITAKENARAELPSNSLLWDHPEWTQVARRMRAADRAAGELESVLQFWLPAFLAVGVGIAAGTLVPIGRLGKSNGLDESLLSAVRREHRRARALAALSMILASLSAAEFLARWRPDWYVPPRWDSWLSSIAPSVSLLLRAALPLAGAAALAVLGVQSIRHAKKVGALLRHAPSEGEHDRRPDTLVDGSNPLDKPPRVCLQASVLQIRTYGLISIAFAAALLVTLGFWKHRGVVAEGRFRPEDLLYDPDLAPLAVLAPIVLGFAVVPLSLGLGLVTAAPWLASFPWRRRERARSEQCQRCGAFLAPSSDRCWDCAEVVRCAACRHPVRADQLTCSECGVHRPLPRTNAPAMSGAKRY